MRKAFTLLFLVLAIQIHSTPQYYCTAANSWYFPHLLNLIGSIHETNYEQLEEIAVFDLGLSDAEIEELNQIEKVHIYKLRENNPNLLTYFYLPIAGKRAVLGWYAWKPVVMKEALEMFPYVLWVDSGTEVMKPLDGLFDYIVENGYFICTIGDYKDNLLFPVSWGTTSFVIEQFHLNDPDKKWILSKEFIMGGIVGASQNGYQVLIKDWYELTKDIRYYADDGTAPDGYGCGRHDQTLLSVLGYLKGLTVHRQDYLQKEPMLLPTKKGIVSLHITHNGRYVCDLTCLFSCRGELSRLEHTFSTIRYKETSSFPLRRSIDKWVGGRSYAKKFR